MDKKTTGAWLVHHTGKLGLTEDPVGSFDRIKVAGKAAVLLSAITQEKQRQVADQRLEALAKGARINPTFELPRVIQTLQDSHLVEVGSGGIEVLGMTTPAILGHASDIFSGLDPTSEERATLEIAERCSQSPVRKEELTEEIQDRFQLNKGRTVDLLTAAEEIGFTDFEDLEKDDRTYFNGNLFRRDDLVKVQAVLASVKPEDSRRITEFDDTLKTSGCVEVAVAERILGAALFKKLQGIGMYDVNVVKNANEAVLFVTRPSAFTKYGSSAISDAFDLAKAFVACLSYGIHRSHPGRGRIVLIDLLLRKLLRGEWVGPASAIGEDYKVLEVKGVISVRPDGSRFYMKLLKREVGELAMQVLTLGDASEMSLTSLPGAPVTDYLSPESERALLRKKQRNTSDRQINELLRNLRTAKTIGG